MKLYANHHIRAAKTVSRDEFEATEDKYLDDLSDIAEDTAKDAGYMLVSIDYNEDEHGNPSRTVRVRKDRDERAITIHLYYDYDKEYDDDIYTDSVDEGLAPWRIQKSDIVEYVKDRLK